MFYKLAFSTFNSLFAKRMAAVDKKHWEDIYAHKTPDEVSWTQPVLGSAAAIFHKVKLDSDAKLIDVGSGRIGMIDYWLGKGYKNITALDISGNALEHLSKDFLNTGGKHIKTIEADVLEYNTTDLYDYWNDRAVFHFLTLESDQQQYVKQVNELVGEYMCIGTFAKDGPEKCSGLDIIQYDPKDLEALFSEQFSLIHSEYETHQTPFETEQSFVFCLFKRKES